MELIQVDSIDLQPAQRSLDLLDNRLAGGEAAWKVVFIRQHAALGGENDRLAPFLDRLSSNFLGQPKAVGMGGVDPVDAGLEGPSKNGLDGVFLRLRSPAHAPFAATDGPCAKANQSESGFRIAKSAEFPCGS